MNYIQRVSAKALIILLFLVIFSVYDWQCAAAFQDSKEWKRSVVTTAILDLTIQQNSLSVLGLSDSTTASTLTITNSGSIPFRYDLRSIATSSECLERVYFSLNLGEEQPLTAFSTRTLPSHKSDSLKIFLTAPEDSSKNSTTCDIEFTVIAWQTNMDAPDRGFTAKKIVQITLDVDIPPLPAITPPTQELEKMPTILAVPSGLVTETATRPPQEPLEQEAAPVSDQPVSSADFETQPLQQNQVQEEVTNEPPLEPSTLEQPIATEQPPPEHVESSKEPVETESPEEPPTNETFASLDLDQSKPSVPVPNPSQIVETTEQTEDTSIATDE